MARLSDLTGDYSQAGSIIDRQQIVGVDGTETTFLLTFVDGAEEVYLNGARLFKGPAQDYVTSTTPQGSSIVLNSPLGIGDELLLVGRSSTNEIPFNKAQGETVVLEDGQVIVDFNAIETDGIEVYVNGPLVDRGRLVSPEDFTITSTTRITLSHSFPAGTVLEGVQGGRLAWVDPDNMVVNDGVNSKSLSARFRDTQESRPYFIQTNGVNLQDLFVGLQLKKWFVDQNGVPYEDTTGYYPVLKLGKTYWDPQITGSSLSYVVSRWDIQGQTMIITAVDTTTGATHLLTYVRRVRQQSLESTEVDYGLITEDVYDQYDDGGLN